MLLSSSRNDANGSVSPKLQALLALLLTLAAVLLCGPTGVGMAAAKQVESASRWVRVVWIINALAVAIVATLWVVGKKRGWSLIK